MTRPDADKVWDILVSAAGAYARGRENFRHAWPTTSEYRFTGNLGFGGKVRHEQGRTYVTCYSEDETTERRATMQVTNRMLEGLQTPTSGLTPIVMLLHGHGTFNCTTQELDAAIDKYLPCRVMDLRVLIEERTGVSYTDVHSISECLVVLADLDGYANHRTTRHDPPKR